jgi:hypothetical protein
MTKLDISTESKTTMDKFGTLRKFKLGDGPKRQFNLHIKIPDMRIYILPTDDCKIAIGYIGKHLKTSKFQ